VWARNPICLFDFGWGKTGRCRLTQGGHADRVQEDTPGCAGTASRHAFEALRQQGPPGVSSCIKSRVVTH